MTNRFNLPDIEFFNKSPDVILSEMLQHIGDKTGFEFQRADPRRKFVEGLAIFVSMERNRADFALKQNLLAYAADNALDLKGDEFGTSRLEASVATTTIRFNLELERNVALVIPAATTVKIANVFFETTDVHVAPVGQNSIDLIMRCTEAGDAGNDYLPGETTTLVDPLPYVKFVENLTITAGGADVEQDDQYAVRIRLAPEKFSTAGPELAYKYFALTASQDIVDVEIDTPSPSVTRIVALLKEGELPSQHHLDAILTVCSASNIRPLTDHVIAEAPTTQPFDMHVRYWLPRSKAAVATDLITQIEARFSAYLLWQKSKLGRDINPTEVIDRLKNLDENIKGAERVEVDTSYTVISKTAIAVANEATIEFVGFIDD